MTTCGCKRPDQTGTRNGYRCAYHRDEYVAIRVAIRDIEVEWTRYIGHGDVEGHDDAVQVGQVIASALETLEPKPNSHHAMGQEDAV